MILMKLESVLLKRNLLRSSRDLKHLCFNLQQTIHYQQRHFSLAGFYDSISTSEPVNFMQNSLVQLHDISGLPWWSTIIVSTILLRGVITFPLSINQSKTVAKLENLQEEMPALVKELKMETAYAVKKFGWTEKQARIMYNRSLKQQWNKLIIRDNCHPLKASIIVLIQIPMWITQSWAIRNLIYMRPDPTSFDAQIIFAQLVGGGFVWIPNLTEVDHSFILPIALGLLNLTNVTMQSMRKTVRVDSKLRKYTTNFFRFLSVCMVPLAAITPSGIVLYWVTSSAVGLIQNVILLSPRFKRFMGIPKTKSEHERPYTFILDEVKTKLRLN